MELVFQNFTSSFRRREDLLPSVEATVKIVFKSLPSQEEKSAILAHELYGEGDQEEGASTLLQLMSDGLLLTGLRTQQVIALCFKDKEAASRLQQEKVAIASRYGL